MTKCNDIEVVDTKEFIKQYQEEVKKIDKIEVNATPAAKPLRLPTCWSYIQKFIKIRSKNARLIPFIPNAPQKRLYDTIRDIKNKKKPVRIIILKARQMGFSTMTGAILFYHTIWRRYVNTAVVAHTSDAASKLFNMYKLMYDELPDNIKPMVQRSNAREMVFDGSHGETKGLHSSIRIYSADTQGLGRGQTLNYVHLSEVAFWSDNALEENFLGLMQAVPDDPNTMVIIESTANGYNQFQQMWQDAVDGKSGFIPIFFPWFEDNQYKRPVADRKLFAESLTDDEKRYMRKYKLSYEQMNWRRWCIATNCNGSEEKFKQEYPSNPDEAFLMSGTPYFNSTKVKLQMDYLNSLLPEDYIEDTGLFEIEYQNTLIHRFFWHHTDTVDASITIYKKPEKNVPYVIGADTSGDGSDYFVAYVVDNRNGEMVAKYRKQVGEKDFTHQIYCLAFYYNKALVSIEANFSTFPNMELQRLGYGHLYIREVFDDYSKLNVKRFGFRTQANNRMTILANIQALVSEAPKLIKDTDLLHEMMVFALIDRKVQAPSGEHDDCIMAWAITQFCRRQQSVKLLNETNAYEMFETEYRESGYDDYDKAYKNYVSGGVW